MWGLTLPDPNEIENHSCFVDATEKGRGLFIRLIREEDSIMLRNKFQRRILDVYFLRDWIRVEPWEKLPGDLLRNDFRRICVGKEGRDD